MAIIEVKDLSKTFKVKLKEKGLKGSVKSIVRPDYKVVNAVNDISFSINEGEVIAFIGPNGAGKSTTIKMITGILYPDSGSINVLGIDPQKDRKKLAYKIGTVFGQKEQLWTHLTPYDNFKFFGAIYDMANDDVEKRITELTDLFDLSGFINIPVRNLSLGQRIRCEIVASLIHNPKILFLDEPTIGLDPVIHDGKIVLDDSMTNLKYHYLNKKVIEAKLEESPELSGLKGVRILKKKGNGISLEVDITQTSVPKVIKALRLENIQDINISNTPLETIIKDIYRKEKSS